ncbi:DNA-3-methyladenine glycosylase [Granulicella mallensis]|jgi:DNA-3-methyladenine glycosylase|uniref:Putative 3-methyladenine DNA glycosylase n=1 Tax=Granulicella mallensis TaxID=940614 RepID=A0A7W7ZQE1_9BACT|nr:DNA-3-methyladenine glycosylase [Granulicella mallensis]MBB5064225.1 DNA-3-methyladenine glycosylase [Granulicella mallensis]
MTRALPKPVLLPRSFYLDSPEIVARALLGKLITHHRDGERLTGRITEVEAYLGFADPASHTYGGRTDRNSVLFGPPGFAYVYFIYGMHYCLNVSCLPDGQPGGVLFRALEPIEGLETMAELRGLQSGVKPQLLTGGPGRLTQALGITRAPINGIDVTLRGSPLQILDDGYRPDHIDVTPRIGISKAADRLLRFVVNKKK